MDRKGEATVKEWKTLSHSRRAFYLAVLLMFVIVFALSLLTAVLPEWSSMLWKRKKRS